LARLVLARFDEGLERRNQPQFQTRQFVERLGRRAGVTTASAGMTISLMPSFRRAETFYDSSLSDGHVTGSNLVRSTRDVTVDLVLPSLAPIFDAPSWIGEKMKHVIDRGPPTAT